MYSTVEMYFSEIVKLIGFLLTELYFYARIWAKKNTGSKGWRPTCVLRLINAELYQKVYTFARGKPSFYSSSHKNAQ